MDRRAERPQRIRVESAAARPPAPGASAWLLLGGIAVSCTGVGAVLGVPLIALALALPRAQRSSGDPVQSAVPARERGARTASLSG